MSSADTEVDDFGNIESLSVSLRLEWYTSPFSFAKKKMGFCAEVLLQMEKSVSFWPCMGTDYSEIMVRDSTMLVYSDSLLSSLSDALFDFIGPSHEYKVPLTESRKKGSTALVTRAASSRSSRDFAVTVSSLKSTIKADLSSSISATCTGSNAPEPTALSPTLAPYIDSLFFWFFMF